MLLEITVFAALWVYSTAEAPDRVRQLEEKFVAPCCWRESIATHTSPEADRMRAKVQELVSEGKTDKEIVDFFVSRLGERILREPPGQKAVWLYVFPGFATTVGLFMLLRFVRKSLQKQRLIEVQNK